MANLEKRIAALETASAVGAEPITTVVRFIAPGHLGAEMQALHTQDGQSWQRAKGETQQALIARASSEVQRTAWGVAILLEGASKMIATSARN